MRELLTLSDISKVLIKKYKQIIVLAVLLATVMGAGLFYFDSKQIDHSRYFVKIYGLKEFTPMTDSNQYSINAESSTVNAVFSSEIIQNSLENIDTEKLSTDFLNSFVPSYQETPEAKQALAKQLFQNYKAEVTEGSNLFVIVFTGNDLESCEYVAEYLFMEGQKLVNQNLEHVSVKYFDKQIEEKADAKISKIKICIIALFGGGIFSLMLFVLFIIGSNRVISKTQLRMKYGVTVHEISRRNQSEYDYFIRMLRYRFRDKAKNVVFYDLNGNNQDVAAKLCEETEDLSNLNGLCYGCIKAKNGTDVKIIYVRSTDVLQDLIKKYENNICAYLINESGITKFIDNDRIVELFNLLDIPIEGIVLIA